MGKIYFVVAALAGGAAVGMAAYAAHAPLAPDLREALRGAVQMQGWHALALLVTALWLERLGGPRLLHGAAGAFIVGTLLFCGAIYLHVLAGVRLGPVAPVGGVLLMAGWALLAAAGALDRGRRPS